MEKSRPQLFLSLSNTFNKKSFISNAIRPCAAVSGFNDNGWAWFSRWNARIAYAPGL
jgi:hypothetical protein